LRTRQFFTRPLPPRHTEDPVTVHNKYGVLDREGDNSEVT